MEAGSLLQEALLRQADRQQLSDSDQDLLWVDIYLLPPLSRAASCEKDALISKLLELAKLCKEVNAFFQSLSESFDWHVGGDGPVFGIHASDRIPHLRAICRYGANVADEWTAVELIRQYTISHPGFAVECWDGQDGQILLIESANVLPIWVDSIGPDAMRHRCWIRSGQVQLIAPEENFQTGQISRSMGLQEALQILQEGGPRVETPVRIQEAIRDCVSQLVPDRISDPTEAHSKISTLQCQNQHRHKAVIALPRAVAHLVRERPDLVNAAIVAFANHALQPDRNSSSKSPKIECEDWVMTSHSFSRTNYAMLRTLVSANTWTTETTVPNAYQSVELRRMQRQCAVDATPHLRHAVHIGVRLVAGFEELLQSKEQQPSPSLLQRRVLQYWPQLLRDGLGVESDSVQWLFDAWKMGPNHAVHDISDILECPVVQEEFTSDNVTPLTHPEESLTAQIRKELTKEHNMAFIVPRQDEVDPNEDWMVVTDEAMEQQLKSRNRDTAAHIMATTQPRPAEEQEQAAQLATMLNTFQNFMVDKSGPEGVHHKDASGKSEVPPAETSSPLDQTYTPVQINPRVFLNLLQTVLDKSTTSESISLPPPLGANQNGAAGDDAFFSREDYEAMEPANEYDDNDDDGAVDTDVVELMAAMDDELRGTAAASVVGDARDAGVGAYEDDEALHSEESRILMNLLQSLDAGAGGRGPVQSMMKAMGEAPPFVSSETEIGE